MPKELFIQYIKQQTEGKYHYNTSAHTNWKGNNRFPKLFPRYKQKLDTQ